MTLRSICTAALLLATPAWSAFAQDWVERSNEYTQDVLEAQGEISPETVSYYGLEQFDEETSELTADLAEREIAVNERLIAQLQAARESETDANVRQDLAILIGSLEDENTSTRLSQRLETQWMDVPQMIFQIIGSRLDDQVAQNRYASAVTVLRRYTGLEPGTTPLTEQAKARFAESLGEERVAPYRGDVEQAIARVPALIAGMRELFDRYELGGEDALDEMEAQLTDYAQWEREVVLPAAREDYRLPQELYADRLKNYGIDIDPLQLVARARRGFYETRLQMEALAPVVAAKFGWEETDYPSVIARLKQETIPQDELEAYYRNVGEQIEEIVRREQIVSLPDFPVAMRLGTEAENAASPAPHMRGPRLIGNTGEQGTFVLTTGDPSLAPDARYDDFNYGAAAWFVSAHEARPGHELQFGQMVANGVSLARAIYAGNSVNSEGWALYAEAEVLPFLPVEAQLGALQSRLLRTSRAMLDPMLNLGLINLESARAVLSDEARFSDAMVNQELNRYTFRSPGQAGSYYYGYSQLIDLRIETELALGEDFDQMAFNDFLLSQGRIPIEQMAEAVREDFIPAQRDRTN